MRKVGDGITGAPTLAQADVGLADENRRGDGDGGYGASDPSDMIGAIALSRATVSRMKQNLFWAVGYNTIAFPITASIFYPSIGLLLRPEIAALSMAGCSLLVAINALLLKRVKLPDVRRSEPGERPKPPCPAAPTLAPLGEG